MKELSPPLRTKHEFTDFLYWALIASIAVFSASVALLRHSLLLFVVYVLVVAVSFFGLVFKFFCPRCPYYRKRGKLCRCMCVWNVPKLFRIKDGPYMKYELYLAAAGLAAIFLFPVYWLVQVPALLVVYVLSLIVYAVTMFRYECVRCIHFYCPFNRAQQKES